MLYKIQYFNQVGGLTTEEKGQILEMGYSLNLINDIPEHMNLENASIWAMEHANDLKYKKLFFGDSKIDLSIMDDGGNKTPKYLNEYSKIYGVGNQFQDGNGDISQVINPAMNEKIKKIIQIKFNLNIIELQQVELSNTNKLFDPNTIDFYDKIEDIIDGSIGYKIILHNIKSQEDYKYNRKTYVLDGSDDKINNIINSQELIIFASTRHYTIYFSDNIKSKVERFFQEIAKRSSNKVINQIDTTISLCEQMNHFGKNLCNNNEDIELTRNRKVYTLKGIETSKFMKFKNKLTIPQENNVCYIISIFCAIFLKLSDEDSIRLWNLFFNENKLSEIIKKCN